jgi:hypothetical protein
MNAIAELLHRHWLSVLLIAGALLAVYYVYRHRSKLM